MTEITINMGLEDLSMKRINMYLKKKILCVILCIALSSSFLGKISYSTVYASYACNISQQQLTNTEINSVYSCDYFWVGDDVFYNWVSPDQVFTKAEIYVYDSNGNQMSYEMSESSAMAGGSKKIETSTYEPGRYTAKVIPYSSDTKHGSIQSSFYLMGQPSDVTIKKGESASFSVGNNLANVSYQWYYSDQSTGTSGCKIEGAVGSTYTISASAIDKSMNGRYYFCKCTYDITNTVNKKTISTYSNHAKLTVEYAPNIESNYLNYVQVGSKVSYSVEVSDGNPSQYQYQWYYFESETGDKHKIDNAQSSLYQTVASEQTSKRWYICSVRNGTIITYSQRMNTKLKYSIVYNANGGINTPKEQVKYQGNSLTLSDTTPEKTGYNFAGWSNSSTASEVMYLPGDIYNLDGNVTLYAVWKPKEYKIYYDANGGSNAPETQNKYYGKQEYISNIQPQKTGYKFLGWSVNSGAKEITYKPGDIYVNNEDVKLYAVWEKISGSIVTSAPTLQPSPERTKIPSVSINPSLKQTILPSVTVLPVRTVQSTKTPTVTKTTSSPSTNQQTKMTKVSLKVVGIYVKDSGFRYRKKIKLTWTSANNAQGYYIYRSDGMKKEKQIAKVEGYETKKWCDSNVKAGKTYSYRIVPFCKSSGVQETKGSFSNKETVVVGISLKKPKAKIVIKKKWMTMTISSIEGDKIETQYRWNNMPVWKKQSKIQGAVKKKIVKKLSAKGFYLRIRSYEIVDGKKIYSKWSSPIKVE